MHRVNLGEEIDLPHLMAELRRQAEAVNRGELAQSEAMLINQATALQSLFARLVEKAMACDNVQMFETYMRMALRAQSQCRATLETLAAIKNPAPVAFVKQANIAAGPQQVNNGPPPKEGSRTRETEIEPNKLLEAQNGERLDTGATGSPSAANQALEAVGAVNGTEDAWS